MSVSTIYETAADGTMTLKFLLDGMEKTNYVFETDGCIVMHERKTKHTNTYQAFLDGLELVSDWVKRIKRTHYRKPQQSASDSKITKYSLASQYQKNGNLKFVFKIGKTKVIHTVYDVKENVIRFAPRPTVKMCFKDFENLLNYQVYMGKLLGLLLQSKDHLDTDLDDEI